MSAEITTPDGWTLTPPPDVTFDDPPRAMLAAAGEALRATGHDRRRPEQPGDLYSRLAELQDILGKLTSVASRLSGEARAMADRPDLTGENPQASLEECTGYLDFVIEDVDSAQRAASSAQSAITWVGAR